MAVTYGEAHIQKMNKMHNDMSVSFDDSLELQLPPHRKRMIRYDAVEYYNRKLFDYWTGIFGDKTAFLMFRTNDLRFANIAKDTHQ